MYPFTLQKSHILCRLLESVEGYYRSQAEAIRSGSSLSKPILCDFFQMTAYTHSICPELCSTKYKDKNDLLILKSQRITVVCIEKSIGIINITLHLRVGCYNTLDAILLWLAPMCEKEMVSKMIEHIHCRPVQKLNHIPWLQIKFITLCLVTVLIWKE